MVTMQRVKIYTTPVCPYCARAKSLLKQKGAIVDEIDVFMDSDARKEMQTKAAGRQTVPQIFVGEVHIGGCEDLYVLDRDGKLDPLLNE
ncbi:MAG TPA: glutaredoxin 3 [Rhizomicrobium sp.]